MLCVNIVNTCRGVNLWECHDSVSTRSGIINRKDSRLNDNKDR